MTAGTSAQRCQELALRQHGVIARSQALAQGMSASAIDRRMHSGEWLRLLPGTYALRGSPASFMRRATAAYLWAGKGTLLSHDTSGILFDLDGVSTRTISVSSPRRLSSPRVVVHRRPTNVLPSKKIEVVRVTSIEQTLLDLGGNLGSERLELALDSALRQGPHSLRSPHPAPSDLRWAGRGGIDSLGADPQDARALSPPDRQHPRGRAIEAGAQF